MTAMNLIAQPDAAYMLADAATTNGAGRLVAIGSKIVTVPHLHLAVGWTGRFPKGQAERSRVRVRAALAAVTDQAAVLPALAGLLVEQQAENLSDSPTLERHGFSIMLALWHVDRGEPQLWVIHSDVPEWLPADSSPGQPVRMRQLVNTAGAGAAIPGFPHLPLADVGLPACFDPERDAARLLTAQRVLPDPVWGYYNVGGFGEVVRVDRTGVHRRTVCRWPDKIGRPISPGVTSAGRLRLADRLARASHVVPASIIAAVAGRGLGWW